MFFRRSFSHMLLLRIALSCSFPLAYLPTRTFLRPLAPTHAPQHGHHWSGRAEPQRGITARPALEHPHRALPDSAAASDGASPLSSTLEKLEEMESRFVKLEAALAKSKRRTRQAELGEKALEELEEKIVVTPRGRRVGATGG